MSRRISTFLLTKRQSLKRFKPSSEKHAARVASEEFAAAMVERVVLEPEETELAVLAERASAVVTVAALGLAADRCPTLTEKRCASACKNSEKPAERNSPRS